MSDNIFSDWFELKFICPNSTAQNLKYSLELLKPDENNPTSTILFTLILKILHFIEKNSKDLK